MVSVRELVTFVFLIFKFTWIFNKNSILKFQFANKVDIILMVIGSLGSLAGGVMLPLVILVFTNIIDSFSGYGSLACSK